MTLRQLIRQYIKEGLENQLNRKNSMKRHYLNEESDDDPRYDEEYYYNARLREIERQSRLAKYRNSPNEIDYTTDDPNYNELIQYLEDDEIIDISKGIVLDTGYIIKSGFFHNREILYIEMKIIDKYIKNDAKLVDKFVEELNRLKLAGSIIEITTSYASYDRACTYMANEHIDFLGKGLNFLKKDNLNLYNKIFDELGKELYKLLTSKGDVYNWYRINHRTYMYN